MSQFLFVVEVPQGPRGASEPTHSSEYIAFLNAANKILSPLKKGACVPMQGNVWLISADNNWQVLMDLSSTAATQKLSYSIGLIQDGMTHLTMP